MHVHVHTGRRKDECLQAGVFFLFLLLHYGFLFIDRHVDHVRPHTDSVWCEFTCWPWCCSQSQLLCSRQPLDFQSGNPRRRTPSSRRWSSHRKCWPGSDGSSLPFCNRQLKLCTLPKQKIIIIITINMWKYRQTYNYLDFFYLHLDHLNWCGVSKHVSHLCFHTEGHTIVYVWNKSITFLTERWSCRQTQPCQPGSRRGAAGTPHCRSSVLCRNNRRIRRSTAGSPVEVKHKDTVIIQAH